MIKKAKYKVVKGIFEGTVFKGEKIGDRFINLDSAGQAFPVENCKLIETEENIDGIDFVFNYG